MEKELPIWSVAVFAHNERKAIGACLESIFAQKIEAELHVYVLANGCTDGTASEVLKLAAKWPAVRLIEIKLGDKANAWNIFVHELAPASAIYFFVDGDVRLDTDALRRLAHAIQSSPESSIASAVPGSGRHRAKYTKLIIEEHGVQGNFYCISSIFVSKLRLRNIRLPVGFVREDGLVGALAKFSLDPKTERWNDSRVKICSEAKFIFRSMRSWHPSDWRKYYRRRVRYSVGHFENRMWRSIWWHQGTESMPANITELYRASGPQKLKWRGLNTLFDWLALRRINAKRIG